jgi:polyphosphate kinase
VLSQRDVLWYTTCHHDRFSEAGCRFPDKLKRFSAINLSSEEILSGNFIVFAEDISNVKLKALFLEVEHEGISGLKT